MDTATMHKMMTNRPADAISGFTTEDGTIIWQKELPLDRCTYPKYIFLFEKHINTFVNTFR